MWTKETIEAALDSGNMEAEVRNGRWWKIRRNGQTKLWKTRPNDFKIPIKAGLRACAYITHDNMNSGLYRQIDGRS